MKKKIIEILKETEKEIKSRPKVKDKCLDADVIKTLKAMAYIKIKDLFRKEK
jgi:hypothetical protein